MKIIQATIFSLVLWIVGYFILIQMLEAYEVEETSRMQAYYKSLQNPESSPINRAFSK